MLKDGYKQGLWISKSDVLRFSIVHYASEDTVFKRFRAMFISVGLRGTVLADMHKGPRIRGRNRHLDPVSRNRRIQPVKTKNKKNNNFEPNGSFDL